MQRPASVAIAIFFIKYVPLLKFKFLNTEWAVARRKKTYYRK